MASWRSVPAPDLPDGLVLFDGVCALCSGLVRFLIARDRSARLRYVAMQSELGRALAERFGVDADAPQTVVVIAGGRAHFKSESAIAALAGLPGWRWVAAARLLPSRVRNALYDGVARNRYRLFGRYDACMRPAQGLAERFLETRADLERVAGR